MSAESLLAKLEGLKKTGSKRYVARCPAHDDRSPSLAIRDLGDGRILLHCFAGCPTESVLGAMGLAFADIMPERVGNYAPERTPFDARQCLEAVAHEMACAVLICENVADGAIVSGGLRDRLLLAGQRINGAVGMCGPPAAAPEIKKLRRGEYAP
jgi:hypothetical protein